VTGEATATLPGGYSDPDYFKFLASPGDELGVVLTRAIDGVFHVIDREGRRSGRSIRSATRTTTITAWRSRRDGRTW
jgi:hypothetical protein